jgi:hypothetical protein
MTSEKDVAEIRESLVTITRLLAAQIGADLKIADRAPLLERLGVDRDSIAVVCDTTPDVVRVRVGEARRGRRGARRNSGSTRAPVEAKV